MCNLTHIHISPVQRMLLRTVDCISLRFSKGLNKPITRKGNPSPPNSRKFLEGTVSKSNSRSSGELSNRGCQRSEEEGVVTIPHAVFLVLIARVCVLQEQADGVSQLER